MHHANADPDKLQRDNLRRTSPETYAKRLAQQIAKLGFTRTIAPTPTVEVVSI
jgi:hypothetical protein